MYQPRQKNIKLGFSDLLKTVKRLTIYQKSVEKRQLMQLMRKLKTKYIRRRSWLFIHVQLKHNTIKIFQEYQAKKACITMIKIKLTAYESKLVC